MLNLLTAPLRFVVGAVTPPSPPTHRTPATMTYYATPPEAAERGLELRDPPEAGWQKRA
jgi:hypothetical protein